MALAILICLISFLDNFLVVYVVHRDSRLKSLTNVFVQNLALTDISMATLHMPFWVISLYTGTWIFSERWCEIQAVINCTLGVASILNMGLIAFNRYIRVVKPALYSRLFLSKLEKGTILLRPGKDSFFTSYTTPPLYGWGKMAYHPLFAICTFNWTAGDITWAMITVSGVINGTTVSIFYSYYKIYKSLKESTQNLNAHSIEDAAASSRRPATDIRLLKTSFTVFCVFLVTWGPVTAVVIVETAGSLIPREIFTVAIYLMFISSLVNPIICGIMNPPFQAAFKRALNFGRYGNNQIRESSTGNRDKP